MLETMAGFRSFGWLVQIPFYFMELLVGLVQALVFMLLTAVFTLLICQHHENADLRLRTITEKGVSRHMMGNLARRPRGAGRGPGRRLDRREGVGGRRTQSRRIDAGDGPVDSGHRVCGSDRVLRAVPRRVKRGGASAGREDGTMTIFALMAQDERRAGPGVRQDVRHRLAAPDRADHQLRHRLRAALLARLSAGAAHARRAAAADRPGAGEHREDQRRPGRHRGAAAGRVERSPGPVDPADRRSPRDRHAPARTGSAARRRRRRSRS